VEKVSFTLSLWGVATAIIPSRDHTGFPSTSIPRRSAVGSRMVLRTLASVLPRQSVSPEISGQCVPMDSLDLYTSNSCPVFILLERSRRTT